MEHSKKYKSVKTSKAGAALDYKISVRKLEEPMGEEFRDHGCTHRVVGGYVKPCGDYIYNITVRNFKSANAAMAGYAKLIKEKAKEFKQYETN